MTAPAAIVEHSERLTRIFGEWPSFHDAEVIELHLWRGDVDPDRERWIFPVLTVKLHVHELTDQTDANGYLITLHHTLVTLRFHDVEENVEIGGFNHQNAIYELIITRETRDSGPSPYLQVEFVQSFGVGARFRCRRVEVLAATPYVAEGNTPSLE